MATLTSYETDQTVRQHLATLAKELRHKFTNTAYQGDYVDTITGDTYGDRLQVGTQRTVKGTRYLFVLNVDVDKQAGGQVSTRVTTWTLDASTGLPVGHHTIKKTPMSGVKLTATGFNERVSRIYVPVNMSQRIDGQLNLAEKLLGAGFAGREVKDVHTDRNGENPYGTYDAHLLPFGGVAGAGARLSK